MRVEEGAPPRPYIPPSAAGALAACAVAAVLLECAWQDYLGGKELWLGAGPLALCALVACACTAAAFVARRVGMSAAARWAAWAACGCVIGAVSCALWAASMQASHAALTGSVSAYRFVASSEGSVGSFGVSCTARAVDAAGAEAGRVRLTAQDAYEVGETLALVGRFEELNDSDWARSRFMKGEVASVDAVRVISVDPPSGFDPIRDLRAAALRAVDPARSEGRALIAGTVCGSVAELNQTEASDRFAATGLSHLIAVSGSHLALIAAFVERLMARTRLSRGTRFSIIGALSIAYVLFTGCAASAVRSVAMVCLTMFAQGGRRRAHGISALCLTTMGFVALNPGVVYDLGFRLSATSVLFIAVFSRSIAWHLARLGCPGAIGEALSLTLSAQWATLPLTIPVFGTLSLIAPVANLVVGPLMSGLLLCGIVAVPLCVLAPVLAPLMAVPEGIANASIFAARLLASVPLASIPVALDGLSLAVPYVLAVACYLLWPVLSRRALAGALVAATSACAGWLVFWLFFAPAGITVLDVGQADAILVRDGSGCMLVDAGVDGAVVDALARNHVFQLDAVVITHWDRDHWGGLPDVLDAVGVGQVFVARGAAGAVPEELEDDLEGRAVELDAGDTVRAGDFTCNVVWPQQEVAGEENGDSLVLDVRYDSGGRSLSAVLTGDTEVDQEHDYAELVGRIDVLKLGHHGSEASVDAQVLDVFDPELAIASAGEGNSYGHPDPACVRAVEEHGSRFLCTKDVGDIAIEPGREGFRVRCAGGSG